MTSPPNGALVSHLTAYYNEIDPYAAQWLRNLISAGHIAPGDVDERSIVDVQPDDLSGYEQCHFFAGIGGWSVALRLAGWSDDRPVWTGSCPCQPFSAAGTGKAADDGRHLWPAWFPLIAERNPPVVFGEQVEAAIGWGWLDAVFSDLEQEGYACGATVLPACGIGAPHIRQRLWFVADALCGRADNAPGEGLGAEAAPDGKDGCLPGQRLRLGQQGAVGSLAHADGGDTSAEGLQRGREHGQQPQDGGDMADAQGRGQREFRDAARPGSSGHADGSIVADILAHTERDGRWPDQSRGQEDWRKADGRPGFWTCEWLPCSDGKARPIEPGSFPLAHGVQRRTSKLRAYGNAIVPQIAAAFIAATMTR